MSAISLDDFKKLLRVGWKLCSAPTDYPRKDQFNTPEVWAVCLAALPESIGIKLLTDPFAGGGLSGAQNHAELRENPPGHRHVLVTCTGEADAYFQGLLKGDHYVKTDPELYLIPIQRAFIRLDVAKFSQFPVSLQPLILADIQETADLILSQEYEGKAPVPEEIIHTGDGFIAVFQWEPKDKESDWLLAKAGQIAARLDLKNDNEERIKVRFRISITLGEVYLTRDLKGRSNYAGAAITETERLISCMPANVDDLVYFDEKVYREQRNVLQDRFSRVGSVADKHGVYHRIYSLEYVEFGEWS